MEGSTSYIDHQYILDVSNVKMVNEYLFLLLLFFLADWIKAQNQNGLFFNLKKTSFWKKRNNGIEILSFKEI